MTPIGINLPNDQAIREAYGSKSVSLSNIFDAYNKSTPALAARGVLVVAGRSGAGRAVGRLRRRALDQPARDHRPRLRARRAGSSPRISSNRLREQYSTLEETRADLVALYFIADPQMVALGLVEADDHRDIVLAEYEGYARNAIVQLRRVREGHAPRRGPHAQPPGDRALADGAHHRDRAPGPRRQDVLRDGRRGRLPRRRRPDAGRDPAHQGAGGLQRGGGAVRGARHALRAGAARRGRGPHRRPRSAGLHGLRQPELEPVRDAAGAITDVRITYPCDFAAQMLRYADRYATLPAA